MKIYHSKYQELFYVKKFNYLEEKWLPATAEMTEEEYKRELLVYVQNFEKFRPKTVLIDVTQLEFKITPEIQIWTINNVVAKVVNYGLKIQAFIVPPDMIEHLQDSDDFDDDDDPDTVKIKYFTSERNAKDWLILESGGRQKRKQ